MTTINTQFKDRLFTFLFGVEENRPWILSLYNAINESAYDDPGEIRINTMKEIIYLGMHNDVSFLIADELNLYEQQSTYNPNMCLRMLQYCGTLYEKYILENGFNKYGSRLIPLPVPKLVVFYNGLEFAEDEWTLQLSDAFPEGAEPDIDVRVRMININYGRNPDLMKACKPLQEYAWLVQKVRNNRQHMNLKDAVDRAINEMPKSCLIKAFLEGHKAEVSNMLLTEYNEAETMELFRQDGIREGREEGREEGRDATFLLAIRNLMKNADIPAWKAMELLNIPESLRAKYSSLL